MIRVRIAVLRSNDNDLEGGSLRSLGGSMTAAKPLTSASRKGRNIGMVRLASLAHRLSPRISAALKRRLSGVVPISPLIKRLIPARVVRLDRRCLYAVAYSFQYIHNPKPTGTNPLTGTIRAQVASPCLIIAWESYST
jgi:hypothetical protein